MRIDQYSNFPPIPQFSTEKRNNTVKTLKSFCFTELQDVQHLVAEERNLLQSKGPM